jgi:hypothetical protein
MEKYKIIRKPLDETRVKQIEMFLRYLEKYKPTPDIKNLIQSLIYLTLNDDFQQAIVRVRRKLKIPDDGFESIEAYEKWRNRERAKQLNREASDFVRENKLTYDRLEPLLIEIIHQYIRLVKIDYPDNKYEDEHLQMIDRFCKRATSSYGRIVSGFDVPDPVLGKQNTDDFDKVWWEVYVQPSDNLTRFRKILQSYFGRMMRYHFKDYLDSGLFRIANKKVIGYWNRRIQKQIKMNVIQDNENLRVILKYQTFFNTKTKEVLREYDRQRKAIRKFQKQNKQCDVRGLNLRERIWHYKLYLQGYSAFRIARMIYGERVKSAQGIKSEHVRISLKDARRLVKCAFSRKVAL